MTDFTPGATGTDEVLFARDGSLGRVLLNRPKAINSLTLGMIRALREQLDAWADDEGLSAVCLEGAGERGFCAGADVRAIREAQLAGSPDARAFFAEEYALDALIAEYPRPVVALMDGIVMGGGLGLTMYADARWMTERSVVAMPETIIGFFPDVAATYLLARAPGELGTHLALSGVSVGGADAVHLGLADAVVESVSLPDRVAALADGGPVMSVPEDASAGDVPLASEQAWVDECYAGDDAAVVVERLRDHPAPGAAEALAAIEQRSPWAVSAALEVVRRAADVGSVREQLDVELGVATGMVAHPDFAEGVRAQLVDKDRQPRWQHADVSEVPRHEVLALFSTTTP